MHYTVYHRPAIAMIELIFAIVIMGIVMMSAPQLISTASKSGYVAIQQEAISEASTHLNNVVSYEWDENLEYLYDEENNYRGIILHTTNHDGDLNISASTHRRRGTPNESLRSTRKGSLDTEFSASAIGSDSGENMNDPDHDIDDFNDYTYNLTNIETSTDMDYVEREDDIVISTSVSYAGDSPSDGTGFQRQNIEYDMPTSAATPTTNIKLITVTASSGSGVNELNKTIVLRAFSCNTGDGSRHTFARKGFE